LRVRVFPSLRRCCGFGCCGRDSRRNRRYHAADAAKNNPNGGDVTNA